MGRTKRLPQQKPGSKPSQSEPPLLSFLTPKQKEILAFIESYGLRQGYSPSQQEIAHHFGFKSLGTVQNYLVRLQRQGALQKTWNGKRSLQLAPQTPSFSSPQPHLAATLLPLVGRVAAGRPLEAIETNEAIEVPMSMLHRGGEHFVLQVNGDSMKEDGILHGDYVIIQKQVSAHNGQTVVALIDNEATLKKFFCRNNEIELHPANAAYKPIIIEKHQDFRIAGILVGVLRQFKH